MPAATTVRACCTSRCDPVGRDCVGGNVVATTEDTGNAPMGNAASVPSIRMPLGYRSTACRKRVLSKIRRLHRMQLPVGSVSVQTPEVLRRSDDILGHTPSTQSWPQNSSRATDCWQGKDDRRALGERWHDKELTGNRLVFHIQRLVRPSRNPVFESGKRPFKRHLYPSRASRLPSRVRSPATPSPYCFLPPISFKERIMKRRRDPSEAGEKLAP